MFVFFCNICLNRANFTKLLKDLHSKLSGPLYIPEVLTFKLEMNSILKYIFNKKILEESFVLHKYFIHCNHTILYFP